MRDLLGGKGAGLAEMTNAGLPVPPGFTITTEACNDYFAAGEKLPDGLWEDVLEAVKEVERLTGKGFGIAADPLLVSVRSGAKFSMPGMMDTVLNLGLNEETLHGPGRADRQRAIRLGRVPAVHPDVRPDRHGREGRALRPCARGGEGGARRRAGHRSRRRGPASPGRRVQGDRPRGTGREFPSDPYEQLDLAIKAVFASWFGKRAVDYRNNQKIAHDLGTAVNVVTMVFGNMGDDSGTGVAFTRDPNTGEKVLFGEYLTNAQGEDVVAGIRTAPKISQMQTDMPEVYAEFRRIGQQLEKHYRDVQDLEFTIERGKLYMLQTRAAKRTAAAAVKIAVDMVDEGLISKEEALGGSSRPTSTSCCATSSTRRPAATATRIAKGLNASPGRRGRAGRVRRRHRRRVGRPRREGRAGPDRDVARRLPRHGRRRGDPDRPRRRDVAMLRSSLARSASPAWPAATSSIDRLRRAGRDCRTASTFAEGDWISLDGSTGEVFVGALPTVSAPVRGPARAPARSWAGPTRSAGCRSGRTPTSPRRPRWPGATAPRASACAAPSTCSARGSGSRSCAARSSSPMVATRAKAKAAAGETLDRRTRPRRVARFDAAMAKLEVLQQGDFEGIFRAMDGLPVVIRLIDPPLHEFLPEPRGPAGQGHPGRGDRRRVRGGQGAPGDDQEPARAEPDARAARLPPRPDDPGLREGPDPGDPQRADRGQGAGGHPKAKIMIPLVGHVNELRRPRRCSRPRRRRSRPTPGSRSSTCSGR